MGAQSSGPLFCLYAAGRKSQFRPAGHSGAGAAAEVAAVPVAAAASGAFADRAGCTDGSAGRTSRWPSEVTRCSPFLIDSKTRSAKSRAPLRSGAWL